MNRIAVCFFLWVSFTSVLFSQCIITQGITLSPNDATLDKFQISNINGINFESRRGGDSIRGTGTSPPYMYTFNIPFSTAPQVGVVNLLGLDGADGGWAHLHGAMSTTQIGLSVDEDQVVDSERSHTTEQVGYIVFETAGSYVQLE